MTWQPSPAGSDKACGHCDTLLTAPATHCHACGARQDETPTAAGSPPGFAGPGQPHQAPPGYPVPGYPVPGQPVPGQPGPLYAAPYGRRLLYGMPTPTGVHKSSLYTAAAVLAWIGLGLVVVGTLGIGLFVAAWMVPLTIMTQTRAVRPQKNTALAICMLLFVNPISGILMLVDESNRV